MFEIDSAVDAYRTCEFATLSKDGIPLTWPTSAKRQDDGTFLITTSLGFPQKAFNIRRDSRVALLFSEPTGSGLANPAQVFVTGTAVCPDDVVTSPAGLESYWAMLFERQPSSRAYLIPPFRWLMDWYYQRLLITITPTSVSLRPLLPVGSPAKPVKELLGGETLARFPSAVASATDAHGAPLLWRVQPTPAPDGYRLPAPDDLPVVAGPASLLVHRHDEKLAKLSTALVCGQLKSVRDGWVLVPERLVEPMASPLTMLRNSRSTAKAYLDRRGLPKPRIQWDEFKAVAASAPR